MSEQQLGHSCQCQKCSELCEHNPGWMTPEEAQIAIGRGFARRLMKDWLDPCTKVGNESRIDILCPASAGHEGMNAPDMPFSVIFSFRPWSKGRCTFLQNGLCEIHDSGFKPVQCRTASGCNDSINKNSPDNYQMAPLWDTDEGRETIKLWEETLEHIKQQHLPKGEVNEKRKCLSEEEA